MTLMVWIALGIVYLVWGSTYFAIAIVVQTLPPLLTAGVRFLLAGLVLAAWVAARRPGGLAMTRWQAAGSAFVGVLLLAGGNGLVSLGERTVPSGLAALIVASVPLWIVLLRLAARDRVGRDVIIGVTVGIVGVAVLVIPSGISGQTDPLGLAMLVVATLAWATGTFASPRLEMPRDAFGSTAVQMIAAGLVLLLVGTLTSERLDTARVSTGSVVAFAYLVVFGSLVAFSAFTWLLQNAPVSLVSTYAYVNPVVAVFLGTIFLSEPLTATMLGGAALILAAVAFIVSRASATASRDRGRAGPIPVPPRPRDPALPDR